MSPAKITGVRDEGFISDDGTESELHLSSTGDDVILKLSFFALQSLAVRATELFRAARMRIGAKPDHLESTVGQAAGISASASIGGKAVVLSILDEHGLQHYFALHPAQSALLRPQMRKAEIQAMNEAQQTRQ